MIEPSFIIILMAVLVGFCLGSLKTLDYSYGTSTHEYRVYFDTAYKTPRSCYNIYSCDKAKHATKTPSPPRPNFRPDPRLGQDEQAVDDDYKNTGFSRGHLVTASYFSYNYDAYYNTFYLTNVAPQNQQANKIWWDKDEECILYWAAESKNCKGEFLIETAVHGNQGSIGNNVVIPEKYLNAVCEPTTGNSICYWQHNKAETDVYFTYVEDCEKETGMTFFVEEKSKFPNCMGKKKSLDQAFWNIHGNYTFSLELARIWNSTAPLF